MAVVLITGCGSGFGLEAALAFAGQGNTVIATVRNMNRSAALAARARKADLDLHIRALDVTHPETFADFLTTASADFGPLDVLVNNAGVIRPGALEDLPESTLREVMETNFFGPLLLTRAALPAMRARNAGIIIMISSLSGIAGLAGDVIYSASKFALEGATEALRHECGRFGIRFALVQCAGYATGLLGPDAAWNDIPADSAYRPLLAARQRAATQSHASAPHPRAVGELLPQIARDDSGRLRWQADDLSRRVMDTLWRADDSSREQFLRQASDIQWWLQGKATEESE
ncbi:MAG: SDR family NAD(P)-dependent oxidoreductase [Parahaliea sp.]